MVKPVAVPARPSYSSATPVAAGSISRSAIELVIRTVQTHLDQPLSLEELAEIAGFSAYHFHRVFRSVTGIPPNEFLTTLRLQEAKRLLLTTSSSVTDICFDVGYISLGTFTARFTHLVGVSPGRLRRFVNTTALPSMARLHELLPVAGSASLPAGSVSGHIDAPLGTRGPIFVGLFPKPIPQARPIGSTVLAAPGRYDIRGLPDGRYHLLVASLPWAEDPRVPSLPGAGLLVGAGSGPLLVQHGLSSRREDVELRAARLTDPPVLTCLPYLLAQRLSRPTVSA